MKKKLIIILSIIVLISLIFLFKSLKKNDSYKNIVNLFNEVKNEKYLAYFFRYPNLNKKDLENKVKLSMSINELFLKNKKEEYEESEVKKMYNFLFNDNKYKKESTFYKDKDVIYKNNKYYIKNNNVDIKFKIYYQEIKKEYFFNKLYLYVRQAYIKESHDRYDVYKFYNNDYITTVDSIDNIKKYEKELKIYKFEFIMKNDKYYFERIGEVK